jgi:hypothetical protein
MRIPPAISVAIRTAAPYAGGCFRINCGVFRFGIAVDRGVSFDRFVDSSRILSEGYISNVTRGYRNRHTYE